MRDRIASKLASALEIRHLEIVDESDRHRGHAGWREGGETHFQITVVSPAFAGQSRIERHRRVNAILGEELSGPVHALSIRALTPEEAAAQPRTGSRS